MDAELQKKKMEMDAHMAEFETWYHEWNMTHVEFWAKMAEDIAHEVCMDDACVAQAMEYFHKGVEAGEIHNGVTEEEVREFVMVCEKIAGPPELVTTCEAAGAHMSYEASEKYAEEHGGRLATSGELDKVLGGT